MCFSRLHWQACQTHILRSTMCVTKIATSLGNSILCVSLQTGRCDWLMVNKSGMAIRFSSADVSSMGRTAKGVKGMQLLKDDCIVLAAPISNRMMLLCLPIWAMPNSRVPTVLRPSAGAEKGVKAVSSQKRCKRLLLWPLPSAFQSRVPYS